MDKKKMTNFSDLINLKMRLRKTAVTQYYKIRVLDDYINSVYNMNKITIEKH